MLHNPESISILLTIAQTSFKFTCDNLVIYVFAFRFVLTRHSLLVARPIRSQPLRVSSLTSGEFRLPWQHGISPEPVQADLLHNRGKSFALEEVS